MPNSDKNLQFDVQGASASAQEPAKVAQSILSLSDEEIACRFESLTHAQLLRIAPVLRLFLYAISTLEINDKSSDYEKFTEL